MQSLSEYDALFKSIIRGGGCSQVAHLQAVYYYIYYADTQAWEVLQIKQGLDFYRLFHFQRYLALHLINVI